MGIEDSVDKTLTAERERIRAEVHEHPECQALIEQAKGMRMFVYGLDADGAFGVLKSQSQHHNIKLRLIAEQVAKDMLELAKEKKGPSRRIALASADMGPHSSLVASRPSAAQLRTVTKGLQVQRQGHLGAHRPRRGRPGR